MSDGIDLLFPSDMRLLQLVGRCECGAVCTMTTPENADYSWWHCVACGSKNITVLQRHIIGSDAGKAE